MNTPSKTAVLITFAAVLTAGFAFSKSNRSSQSGCCCPGGLSLSALAAESSNATPGNAPAKAVLPRLVDLGADKCVPCKMMAPVLKQLKKEYDGRLEVQFIDVWKEPDAGKAYKISLIPTQIFFDAAGKELFRHEGFISKEDILAKWKELGVTFKPAK